jgi:hypothetical protein
MRGTLRVRWPNPHPQCVGVAPQAGYNRADAALTFSPAAFEIDCVRSSLMANCCHRGTFWKSITNRVGVHDTHNSTVRKTFKTPHRHHAGGAFLTSKGKLILLQIHIAELNLHWWPNMDL